MPTIFPTRTDGVTVLHGSDVNTLQGILDGPVWINVLDPQYGAKGDGVTDDYAAINAAITAASAAYGVVYFPPGTYLINTPIDLSTRGYFKMLGAGGRDGSGVQFSYQPESTIKAGVGLTSCIQAVAGPSTLNVVFENLSFQGCQIPVSITGMSNAKWIQCSFSPVTGTNPDNCGIRLINTFWHRFDRCAFVSSVNTKPSVIIRGQTPTNNVPTSYLMNFTDCVFGTGGVVYQQANNPGGPTATQFYFERCDTENLSGTPMFDLSCSAGVSLTVIGVTMVSCSSSDAGAGYSPYLRAGNGISLQGVTLIDCATVSSGGDAVTTTGTGVIFGLINMSPRGGIITAPSASFNGLFGFRDGTMDFIGQPGAGAGAITNAMSAWTQDAGPAIRMGNSGETNAKFGLERDGKHFWGPGGAGGGWDTNLYRNAAAELRTDSKLRIANSSTVGTLSFGTSTSGGAWDVQDNSGQFSITEAGLTQRFTIEQTSGLITQRGPVTYTQDLRRSKQSPAFSAAPTPDPTLGEIYAMAALTGNVSVGNPVNAAQGQRLRFYWLQDGTGGRTVTYSGTNFRATGITAQTTTANTFTIDEAECLDGTVWRVVRLVTGQT